MTHDEELAGLLKSGEFLVCADYQTGGLWGVLIAPSRDAIVALYPDLYIAGELPPWMTVERFEALQADPLWLDDDPPQGLLRALIDYRTHD